MLCLLGSPSDDTEFMARSLIKRLIPSAKALTQHRALQPLGPIIHDANLWHLNRYSVSVAAFVGVFMAFMPVPMQTLLAASAAIIVRCNLPVTVLLIWISNPVTMPPMFYASYKLGAWMLGIKPESIGFEFTRHWFATQFIDSWQPLLLGSVVNGLVFGLAAFVAMRMLWRLNVIHRWEERKRKRRERLERYS